MVLTTSKASSLAGLLVAAAVLYLAHDEADEIAGAMLGRFLPGAQLFSSQTLDRLGDCACRVICISAVPPHAANHAVYLARRLKKRLPEVKILVGLWTGENVERIGARLRGAGVDEVVSRLADVVARLRRLPRT